MPGRIDGKTFLDMALYLSRFPTLKVLVNPADLALFSTILDRAVSTDGTDPGRSPSRDPGSFEGIPITTMEYMPLGVAAVMEESRGRSGLSEQRMRFLIYFSSGELKIFEIPQFGAGPMIEVDIESVPAGTMIYTRCGLALGVVRIYRQGNGNSPSKEIRHLDDGTPKNRYAYARRHLYKEAKRTGGGKVFVKGGPA